MNKNMNLKIAHTLLLLLPLAASGIFVASNADLLLPLLPLASGIFVASTPPRSDTSSTETYQRHNGRGLQEIMNNQLDYGSLGDGIHNHVGEGVHNLVTSAEPARVSDVVTSHVDYRRIRSCLKKKNGKRKKPSAPQFKSPEGMPELIGSNQGHRVDLNCAYKTTCPKPTVLWFKDNDTDPIMERGKSSGFSTIIINKNKGLLSIMDNRRIDDGNYTCVVKNSYGTISHTFKVHSEGRIIGAKPVLLPNQPGNHTVLTGTNLTLLCQMPYKGPEAQVDIRWFKHYSVEGQLFNDEGKPYAENLQGTNDKLPPLDDQKLELINVTEKDSGFYTCVVKNPYGMAGSSGYVNVKDRFDESDDVIAERSKRNTIVYLATSIGTVVGAILVSSALVWFCKFRKERQKKMLAIENARTVAAWTKKVMIERQTSGTESLLAPIVRIEKMRIPTTSWRNNEDSNTTLSEYEFQLDVDWEFPRELLATCEELGEGAFGKVVRGLAHYSEMDHQGKLVMTSEAKQPVTVAVKMLKEGHTDSDMIDLVKEMEMMKVIGTHVNIINLLGVCTQPQGRPLYVIVEFAPHGNLRDYLRARKPDTIQYLKTRKPGQDKPSPGSPQPISLKDMLSFGWQVGRGMEFLSQRRCVHRDLAARNVLVADQGVVKIADFGMARDLHDSDYYRKVGEGKLPVKWMSPESLFQRVCTTQSDVWSFGILLWEIVTWGDSPYKTVASLDALMELLKAGCRMSKPQGCPSDVYSVMSRCWSYQPELRPQWSSLVAELHVQYLQTRPGEYLELTPPTLDTPPSSPESSTVGFGLARQSSPGFGPPPQSSPGFGLAPQSSPGFGPPPQSSPQVHSPYAFQPNANLSLDNENYVFNDFRFQGIIPSYTAPAGDSIEASDTHSYITVPVSRNQLPSGIARSPPHHNQPPSGLPPSPNHHNNPQSGVLPSPTRHNQHPSRGPPSLSQLNHPSPLVPPPSSHMSSMAVTFPPRHRPSHGTNPISRHHNTSISTPPSPRHQDTSIFFPTSPRYSPIFPVTPSPSAPMLSPVTPQNLTRARGRGPVIPPVGNQTQPSSRGRQLNTPPTVGETSMLNGGRGFNPRDLGLDSPPDSIPDSSHRLSNAGSASSGEGDERSRRGYGVEENSRGYGVEGDERSRGYGVDERSRGYGVEEHSRGYSVSVMRCDGGYLDCGYANCLSEHGGSRVVLAVDTDPMWVGFNKYVDTGQGEVDTEYGYGGIRRGGSRQRGSSESGYGTTLESNSALSGRLPSESDSVFENEPEFSRRKPSLSNNYVKTGAEALQPLLKRL